MTVFKMDIVDNRFQWITTDSRREKNGCSQSPEAYGRVSKKLLAVN